MKSLRITQFISIALIFISIFLFYYCSQTLSYFHTNESVFCSLFSDNTFYKEKKYQGNSTISKLKIENDSSVSYNFTLGDQIDVPYVGIDFSNKDCGDIDLSSYNAMECTFGATNIDYFNIDIHTRLTNIDKKILRFSQCEVKKTPDKDRYVIPFRKMVTPYWWYSVFGIDESLLKKNPDWSKCQAIVIESSRYSEVNKKYYVNLKDVKFLRSKIPFFISLSLCFLFMIISILITRFLKKQEEKRDAVDGTNKKYNTIKETIGNKYSDPNYSINKLCSDLKFSQKEVAKLFKLNGGSSFKRYLNSVRLEEAKRLILNTDRQVTEIAYLVGYNNPSYFNSLFNRRFGQSPSQMRHDK